MYFYDPLDFASTLQNSRNKIHMCLLENPSGSPLSYLTNR